eukprot:GILK01002600.1.p1 GENE.GILK01002600.1~~GILK01002600.1.p1  ORF type:complete len:357 (-),score=57.68 GILK01002600.1:351-1421(-)
MGKARYTFDTNKMAEPESVVTVTSFDVAPAASEPESTMGNATNVIDLVHAFLSAVNQANGELIVASVKQLMANEDAAKELLHNEDMTTGVNQLLNAPSGQEALLMWFYEWYQSGKEDFRKFVLRFVPMLLWTYVSRTLKMEEAPGFEAVFLSIYNDEWLLRKVRPVSFNPPSLAMASVYHTPSSSQKATALTENALKTHERTSGLETIHRLIPEIQKVTGSNRLTMLRVVLCKYNHYISSMPLSSLSTFAEFAKAVSSTSFSEPLPASRERAATRKQVVLNDHVLEELLKGLTFCLNQDAIKPLVIAAIFSIHNKAQRDLYAEVVLTTSCMLSKLRAASATSTNAAAAPGNESQPS